MQIKNTWVLDFEKLFWYLLDKSERMENIALSTLPRFHLKA